MMIFIASEEDRSVLSLSDMLEANNVTVELLRAIQIADVQLYITQFSIADHRNAPSLMSPLCARGTRRCAFRGWRTNFRRLPFIDNLHKNTQKIDCIGIY